MNKAKKIQLVLDTAGIADVLMRAEITAMFLKQPQRGLFRANATAIEAFGTDLGSHLSPDKTGITFAGMALLTGLSIDEAGYLVKRHALKSVGGFYPLTDVVNSMTDRGRCSYHACCDDIAPWSELGLCDYHQHKADDILGEQYAFKAS